MSSLIRGQTVARYGNDHRYQTLAGATLEFYDLSDADQTRRRWGWKPVERSEVGKSPVATAAIDRKGRYRAVVDIPHDALAVALSVDSFYYESVSQSSAFGWLGFTGPIEWSREGREPRTMVDIESRTDDRVGLNINNTPTYIRYDLGQLQSSACSTIGWDEESGLTLDHRWTVAHPYIERVDVRRADEDWSAVAVDPDSLADGATDAGRVATDRQTVIDPPTSCTYTARLQAKRRLTDGEIRVSPEEVRLTFSTEKQ